MSFTDDHGGFSFSCTDAKFSIDASTWSTKLSQLGKIAGPVYIMTAALPDADYISGILSKRPSDIYIIASTDAEVNALKIKATFPQIRIALHPKTNAKLALISPNTAWISSADFGKSKMIESSIGLHSHEVFTRGVNDFFLRYWKESVEIAGATA
ncbi:hypothetical protein [Xanthomonas hydrangeae]|uniref:hypothetical protein n=1 Tax=Xanthomonas hydrangeae TaxID=2775159 RepID=UPI0019663101